MGSWSLGLSSRNVTLSANVQFNRQNVQKRACEITEMILEAVLKTRKKRYFSGPDVLRFCTVVESSASSTFNLVMR